MAELDVCGDRFDESNVSIYLLDESLFSPSRTFLAFLQFLQFSISHYFTIYLNVSIQLTSRLFPILIQC